MSICDWVINEGGEPNLPCPQVLPIGSNIEVGSIEVNAKGNEANGNVDPATPWVPMTGDELIAQNIPERKTIVSENGSPLFYEASVNQILAWRGVGKTVFGLGLSDAIASGGKILDFQADRPRRVLYVDGELPKKQLQERVRDLVGKDCRHNVKLFNPEMLPVPRGLNLLNKADFYALQRMVEAHKTEVLILDSQSTLMSGDANESSFQEAQQEVLRTLRWMGLCIIQMHHVGKAGLQRGISRNDDILDVQMHLKKVQDWAPEDGLLFEIAYEKVRHAANLKSGYLVTRQNGLWICRPTEDTAEAADLFNKGKSVREIAKDMKISKTWAHKLLRKAEAAGLIQMAVKLGPVDSD
jgi:RecA-family ATPase